MTIICALHEPGVGTWIGSDTFTNRDNRKMESGQKWVIRGSRAMSSAGLYLTHNIIQENADELLSIDNKPHEVSKRLRELLIENGFTVKPSEGEPGWMRSHVIYATNEGVWHFGPDGTRYPVNAGQMCADGSGQDFAYGAAHACQLCGAPAQIGAALAAAITLDNGCGGEPFIHLLKSE